MSHFEAVMPEHYSKQDHDWIHGRLLLLPYVLRVNIAQGYSAAWQEAFDLEPVSYRKENAARRTANYRLRVYTDRYTGSLQGEAIKPPSFLL